MKDAKGHGSDPRGASHQEGVEHAHFIGMGRSNAVEAIDQAASYGGLEPSLESYGDNLRDALEGATQEQIRAACDAFVNVLAKRGINYRPHGF